MACPRSRDRPGGDRADVDAAARHGRSKRRRNQSGPRPRAATATSLAIVPRHAATADSRHAATADSRRVHVTRVLRHAIAKLHRAIAGAVAAYARGRHGRSTRSVPVPPA
jgi:hypothetical protein